MINPQIDLLINHVNMVLVHYMFKAQFHAEKFMKNYLTFHFYNVQHNFCFFLLLFLVSIAMQQRSYISQYVCTVLHLLQHKIIKLNILAMTIMKYSHQT